MQPGDIGQQHMKGRRRTNDELGQLPLVAAGRNPALPQVNEVAARLRLARPSEIFVVDGDAVKRRLTVDDRMAVEDGLILERKGVERTTELVHRHDQGRRKLLTVPRLDQRTERVEV